MHKIHSIQLLRGVASILVLIVHAFHKEQQYGQGYFESFAFGHVGVDIFFIISGFVMLYTAGSHSSASEFLIKRAIRILPVYWATLAVVIAVYVVFPHLVNGGRDISILGSLFLIPLSEQLYLNQNAWTLTYEFLFYFIFAFVFLFKGSLGVLGVISIILILSALGQLYSFDTMLLQYVTSSLLIEFLYGFILFAFYKKMTLSQKRQLIFVLLLTVGLLQTIEIPTEYRMIYLGLPALLICTVAVYFERYIARFLEGVADFLGEISYSLYLVHPMSLAGGAMVLSLLGLTHPALFLIVLLVSSILFGWVVYSFVEVPLTRKFKVIYSRYRQK